MFGVACKYFMRAIVAGAIVMEAYELPSLFCRLWNMNLIEKFQMTVKRLEILLHGIQAM